MVFLCSQLRLCWVLFVRGDGGGGGSAVARVTIVSALGHPRAVEHPRRRNKCPLQGSCPCSRRKASNEQWNEDFFSVVGVWC